MASANNPEHALTSLKDFHSQYNRLEGIIKFKMPKVSSKLMINSGRGQNEKLNEIYNRLRDPNGNAERLRRNAIVNNKHKAGASLWHTPSALNNISRSNMSEEMSHALLKGTLQSTRHRRNHTSFFSAASPNDGEVAGQLALQHTDRVNNTQSLTPFLIAGAQQDHSLAQLDLRLGGPARNMQSHQVVSPFRTLPSYGEGGQATSGTVFDQATFDQTFGRPSHPFEAKLAELRDGHAKYKKQDHEAAYYAKKLSYQAQQGHERGHQRQPKMSDWISKEVMLPILGKNKTSMLHSPDQFQIDSISQQKRCINRPYKRTQLRTLEGSRGKASAQASMNKMFEYGFGIASGEIEAPSGRAGRRQASGPNKQGAAGNGQASGGFNNTMKKEKKLS